jgi:hypothetical protein
MVNSAGLDGEVSGGRPPAQIEQKTQMATTGPRQLRNPSTRRELALIWNSSLKFSVGEKVPQAKTERRETQGYSDFSR